MNPFNSAATLVDIVVALLTKVKSVVVARWNRHCRYHHTFKITIANKWGT